MMGHLIATRRVTPGIARVITMLVLMTAAPSGVFAAGTQAQREACTPDAFKLCSAAMPDERRVESCLRDAGPRLSRACYDVFYPPENAESDQVTRGQAVTRDRMQPSAPLRPQNPSMPQMPPGPENDD
jgi:hypothetical protein